MSNSPDSPDSPNTVIIIILTLAIILVTSILYFARRSAKKENFIGDATPITKIVPEPYNYRSPDEILDNDTGILRNYRAPLPYSIANELSYSELYRALQTIFPIGSTDSIKCASVVDKFNDNTYIYSAIKTAILAKFNSYMILTPAGSKGNIKPDELIERYHKYSFYKATNSLLVEFNRDETPNKLIFYLMFGRENKMYLFTVYFAIDIKLNISEGSIDYVFNTVEATGITNNNILGFKPDNANINSAENDGINKVIGIDQNLNSKLRNLKPFEPHLSETASDMPAEIFLPDYQLAKIEEKRLDIARGVHNENKKCFGLIEKAIDEIGGKLKPENRILSQYNNKLFCESYHPEIDQVGLWDAPCQVDTDCPFYKANKNYDNEHGKCDKGSGFCEMPLGVTPYGYTNFGKGGEPICYRDSNGTEKCAEQWAKIKENVVKYETPDYIFLEDSELRRENKDKLEGKGLFANPSI